MKARGRLLKTNLAAAGACACAILGVVGCGSSSSSSSAPSSSSASTGTSTSAAAGAPSTAQLAAEVAGYKKGPVGQPISKWNPGPGPKPTPGLLVDGMTCLQSVPACVRIADGYKSAIKAIGWHGSVVDGTAQQANQRSAMSSFITAHAKGVLLGAIDPHGIADLLGQFVAQGGKFNMTAGINPGPFKGVTPEIDITGTEFEGGKELGRWVANDMHQRAPFC